MLSPNDFQAAGYKCYIDESVRLKGYACKALYQKKFVNGHFFINAYFFELPKSPAFSTVCPWEVEVYFRLKDGATIRIHHFIEKHTTIEDIEKFFASTYEKLECVPWEC